MATFIERGQPTQLRSADASMWELAVKMHKCAVPIWFSARIDCGPGQERLYAEPVTVLATFDRSPKLSPAS